MTVKRLRNICVVFILISMHVQCIRVHEDAKENVTTVLPMLIDQRANQKNNESMEVLSNSTKAMSSTDDKDNQDVEATTTHRIPPTLTNTNNDYVRLSPIKHDKLKQDTKQE